MLLSVHFLRHCTTQSYKCLAASDPVRSRPQRVARPRSGPIQILPRACCRIGATCTKAPGYKKGALRTTCSFNPCCHKPTDFGFLPQPDYLAITVQLPVDMFVLPGLLVIGGVLVSAPPPGLVVSEGAAGGGGGDTAGGGISGSAGAAGAEILVLPAPDGAEDDGMLSGLD
jgi:hypothetical protein